MENLEVFQKLKELHLQRNFILEIEGIHFSKNLQILNLNNNYIKKISNISHLNNLFILNLSDNLIDEFDINEIPKNIIYLYFYDNLFFDKLNILIYRSKCITSLSNLERLDYLNISNKERLILSSNFKVNKVRKHLEFIYEHYNQMKNKRKVFYEEFCSDIKFKESDELIFETVKRKFNQSKFNSQNRNMSFIESSSERMKILKEKLSEVKSKFEKTSDDFDNLKFEQIKEKIKNAFKFNENMDREFNI